MRMSAITGVLGIIVLLSFSCKEKSTGPTTQQPVLFSSRSSKCLSQGFAKSSGLDSVFTYSFTDTLLIDFSAIANCCPDSDRFEISQEIGTDTLIVSVADTALHLCRCVCPYMIEVEFVGLPNDHYVIRCRIGDPQGYVDPIHLVNVYRQK